MSLPQGSKVQAEYVWLGGTGQDLRCKTRTLDEKPTAVDQLPLWNYDGSSCGQAPGDDSEVMLRPVKIYPVSSVPCVHIKIATYGYDMMWKDVMACACCVPCSIVCLVSVPASACGGLVRLVSARVFMCCF